MAKESSVKVVSNKWSDNVYHIENPGPYDFEDSMGWYTTIYWFGYMKYPEGQMPFGGWKKSDYKFAAKIDMTGSGMTAYKYDDAGNVSAWTTYRVQGTGSARNVIATGDSAW
jgi:hypothetical protein